MIPFHTLAQRHLVYAYCAVWILQFGYGGRLMYLWFTERKKEGWRAEKSNGAG